MMHRSLMVQQIPVVGDTTRGVEKNDKCSTVLTMEHLRRNEQKYRLFTEILIPSSCSPLFPLGQCRLVATTPAISTPKGKPILFPEAALWGRDSPFRQFWRCIVSRAFQFLTPATVLTALFAVSGAYYGDSPIFSGAGIWCKSSVKLW